MNFRSLEEFWPFYVNQHSQPSTRRWHFFGTLMAFLILIYSVIFTWWFVFFVPIFGYGFAWYSHFFVEGNCPATFGHPFWSLLCDFKMFGLMLTGQMDKEIKRLGKRPVLQMFHVASHVKIFSFFIVCLYYLVGCIDFLSAFDLVYLGLVDTHEKQEVQDSFDEP